MVHTLIKVGEKEIACLTATAIQKKSLFVLTSHKAVSHDDTRPLYSPTIWKTVSLFVFIYRFWKNGEAHKQMAERKLEQSIAIWRIIVRLIQNR